MITTWHTLAGNRIYLLKIRHHRIKRTHGDCGKTKSYHEATWFNRICVSLKIEHDVCHIKFSPCHRLLSLENEMVRIFRNFDGMVKPRNPITHYCKKPDTLFPKFLCEKRSPKYFVWSYHKTKLARGLLGLNILQKHSLIDANKTPRQLQS